MGLCNGHNGGKPEVDQYKPEAYLHAGYGAVAFHGTTSTTNTSEFVGSRMSFQEEPAKKDVKVLCVLGTGLERK